MDSFAEMVKTAVKEAISEMPNVTMADGRRLYTVPQAAKYLACGPTQVRNLIAGGHLVTVRWPNENGQRNKPYLDRADLDRVIEENKKRGDRSAA